MIDQTVRKWTRFRTVVGESVLQQECLGPTFTQHRILPEIPKSNVQLILSFLAQGFRLERNRINVKYAVKLLFFCIPRHVSHDSCAIGFPACCNRFRNTGCEIHENADLFVAGKHQSIWCIVRNSLHRKGKTVCSQATVFAQTSCFNLIKTLYTFI